MKGMVFLRNQGKADEESVVWMLYSSLCDAKPAARPNSLHTTTEGPMDLP